MIKKTAVFILALFIAGISGVVGGYTQVDVIPSKKIEKIRSILGKYTIKNTHRKNTASLLFEEIDTDGDGIYDDGDGSGTAGDYPCTWGSTSDCDDNCIDNPNSFQDDADSDGVGDICDACPFSLPVKIAGNYYLSLQQAYDAAGNGDIIQSQYIVFKQDLYIDAGKTVAVEGGYDCDYNYPPAKKTLINGNVIIDNGTLTAQSGIFSTTRPGVVKIMPMGDSITRGGGYPTGVLDYPTYRYYLYNKLVEAGWQIDFVGPYNGVGDEFNLPTKNPYITPPEHRDTGHPAFPDQDLAGSTGWKINMFLSGAMSAQTLVEDHNPDMVIVHLGTNDLGTRADTPTEAAYEIGQLVDLIRDGSPDTRIFIAQIIPLMDNAYGRGPGEYLKVQEFNALLPGVISQKNQMAGYPSVVLVDMWNGFDPDTMLAELTHPNAVGDKELAARWYEAIIALY